jgi:NTE family protein
VGIVLSGGGAKGAAHIGVLKYMEEVGIPVSYVTGTSMGSILGGLYALGYNASELEALISEIDWPLYIAGKVERRYLSQRRRKIGNEVLLNIPYGKFTRRDEMEMSAMPLGAVEGDNLLNLFNCLSIGYLDSISFDSMPIPFACVATDLMTGKPKVLRGGEFGRAIRSSMSIPVFFSPVEWEGHLLADGGITNNLPVDICREMGADIIIGLEVATDLATNADDLRSIGCQLQQYLSIMTNRGLEEHRKQCRIYINPDVSGINMLDFNASAITDLVHRGYEAAKAHEEEFLKLKAELCGTGDEEWRTVNGQKRERARTLRPHDSLTIDYMELFVRHRLKKAFTSAL